MVSGGSLEESVSRKDPGIVKLLTGGGFFTVAQVPLALVGLGLCLGYLVQALRGRGTRLSSLAWTSVAGVFAFALLGLVVGYLRAMAGLPPVFHPAQLTPPLMLSLATATYPAVLGFGAAALLTTIAAVAATVRGNRRAVEVRP